MSIRTMLRTWADRETQREAWIAGIYGGIEKPRPKPMTIKSFAKSFTFWAMMTLGAIAIYWLIAFPVVLIAISRAFYAQ